MHNSLDKSSGDYRLFEFAALACTSMVVLGYEIVLTRIFSVVLFASHSFMAIALALLGVGAGAVLAYIGPDLSDLMRRRWLTVGLVFLALTILICVWIILQIEFIPRVIEDPDSQELLKNLTFNQRKKMITDNPEIMSTFKLYAIIPLAFLPFLFGGWIAALIFRGAPSRFGFLYAVDLFGATIGGIFLPLLLYPLGLSGVLSVMALLAITPLIFRGREGVRGSAWAFGAVIGLIIIGHDARLWEIKHAAGFGEKRMLHEMWSPMARVGVIEWSPVQEMYVIDNSSRTFYSPKNEVVISRYDQSLYTIPYELKKGGSVLIIASGGGQEITMASHYDFSRIDAVEISRPIVTDIIERRADDEGNPYKLPNVNPIIADGRSAAMRADIQYDVIEMLEVNFHTLAGQIAQAWSPFLVFTQEAFAEYLARVKDDGYVNYTIFSRSQNPTAGKKGRRLAGIIAGLGYFGAADPGRHLVLLERPYVYGSRLMVMSKPTPFEPAELERIARLSIARNARITMQYPDLSLAAPGLDPLLVQKIQPSRKYVRNVEKAIENTKPMPGAFDAIFTPNNDGDFLPITDDRPYMLGSGIDGKGGRDERMMGRLYRVLFTVVGILIVLFIALPLALRKKGVSFAEPIDPRLIMMLGLTGVGFMSLEIAGIYKYQLFLHHPVIALIIVLSAMILGAGVGSWRTSRNSANPQGSIIRFALASAAAAGVILIAVPIGGHKLLLSLPFYVLAPAAYIMFAFFGFLLGHIVPYSIAAYARNSERNVAYAWAIIAVFSVIGTILGSILSRDRGVYSVAFLGIGCYLTAAIVVSVGARFDSMFDYAPAVIDGEKSAALPVEAEAESAIEEAGPEAEGEPAAEG